MGLVFVPLLPYVLSSVDPRDAGSASGIANAVQQVGSALGLAVIGAVFFGQLSAVASYGHAFAVAAAVQVALLATAGAATLFLPRRIAADAYRQQ